MFAQVESRRYRGGKLVPWVFWNLEIESVSDMLNTASDVQDPRR